MAPQTRNRRVTRSMRAAIADNNVITTSSEEDDKSVGKSDNSDVDSDYEPPVIIKKVHNKKTLKRKPKIQKNIGLDTQNNVASSSFKRVKTLRSEKNSTKSPKKLKSETRKRKKTYDSNNNYQDSDEEVDDWEEVEDADIVDLDAYQPILPDKLKITVRKGVKRRRQPGEWIVPWVRQEVNRIRKRNQANMHKCQLLCFIHRLQWLNRLANKPVIKAYILSLLPNKLLSNQVKTNDLASFLPKVSQWLKKEFTINIDYESQYDNLIDLYDQVLTCFECRLISSILVLQVILVCTLRLFNLPTRLCHLANVVSLKPIDILTKKSKLPRKVSVDDSASSNNESNVILEPTYDDQVVDVKERSRYSIFWVEVFKTNKKEWCCFDVLTGVYNDAKAIVSELEPISYVLAIDGEHFVVDVTARYASDWVSSAMRKRRLMDDWWEETLSLFKRPTFSVFDDADKREFDEILAGTPLPTRFSDFKGHPVFALQRDMHKVQAIYPPDAPTLGIFRGHAVYARDCVHRLATRQTWFRSALVIKPNEKPYKVVDFGKRDRLELFGRWQTEPYEPPQAVNGIVPRNSFGDVDLFQPSMLPKGTVHLTLPGLPRIATQLGIDFAGAVVGFDNNKPCTGFRPVKNGWVVCSEFESTIRQAWADQQAHWKEKKAKERTKRSLNNWKRMIKALVLREKLKIKYG